MKRLLTAILTGAICVAGVLGSAACGDMPESIKTTVTEEEWKTALSYFTESADGGTENPRADFSCKFTETHVSDGKTSTTVTGISIDYSKRAARIERSYGDTADVQYLWKGADACYGWSGESGGSGKGEFKEEIEENELTENFDNLLYRYAGGLYFEMINLVENCREFTYSEENAEYTASLTYSSARSSSGVNVTLRFANGKLVWLAIDSDGAEKICRTFEYVYGCAVTVPDEILNLQTAPVTVKTVDENGWKNALAYFMLDFDNGISAGDYPRTNFRCVWDMGEDGFRNLIWSIDYDNNVAYATPFEGQNVFDEYTWEENGAYFNATENADVKQEITEDVFLMNVNFKVFYAGGLCIWQYGLLNKYEEFTYSAESDAYTATVMYTEYDNNQNADVEKTADVALKFENGKLMRMQTVFVDGYGKQTYTFTYAYGITITVPDDYLNLNAAPLQ